TGADGTPAGGSHTSVPRAVSEGLEFAIPNSVVAFNLGKPVKVSYVVIIDGHPTPSRVFDLTVQAMPQSALASPTIEQADNDGAGPELYTGDLTQASVRMGDWPLIALGQYVWLRLHGTNADGSAYVREIWSAPTAFTNDDWIADGFFTFPLPADELKALQDGSSLALAFKAALGQSTVESEAVEFPVRTYTIKTLVDEKPEITRVENDKGEEILEGATTKSTVITLKGSASKGQKVQIKDGTTVKGDADVDPTTGLWEWTMTDLSVDDHHFTATALYGEGKISEARTLKIIPNPIIIDPATMVLGGVRLINDYGWARKPTTNTVIRRVATGGVAPYTYTSTNSAIASVSNNGTVTGFRQGSTTITVKDKNGGQAQFTVQCNEIKIYKIVKSPSLMAGTYEAITGWIRSVGGITEVERLRELAFNFNHEYPDARIVLGPTYPAYPASNLLRWGYYASFPDNSETSIFLFALPPPNETRFFTNAGYVGEQRVPGYVYALVPV
ncbi:Ig-like domain-containing protein, partial [Pseudomonas fluorescens]|uniref:Ig-like domain-containing protein n=1 Tax=Pseudomonas fluorescens TaxID=294 RepID=UPI003819B5D9